MAELMEYSHLVDMADKNEDPYMSMVYASSWAISVYYAYQRTWKPFNPILGETYEMTNHNGINFIADLQVSHFFRTHIPMTRVTLKRDGVVLDLIPPLTKVHNLIFGRTWVDSPGEMVMTNLTTDQSRGGFARHILQQRDKELRREADREEKRQRFAPKWFDETEEVTPTPWGDLQVYQFNGKYSVHRATADNSEDTTNVKLNQFNPWQFQDLSA
ncbi:predicted protein [Arabidopsis lyrata subsp. lyrata]|uniref:Predicted protein n=1 Tax=Arabidopsis lyrata subsp. lyrata TaxID=81972 RepID=D7MXX3_ARALL|nr:predicted protein [Arabidopsis lyrata subsp. lyrata]